MATWVSKDTSKSYYGKTVTTIGGKTVEASNVAYLSSGNPFLVSETSTAAQSWVVESTKTPEEKAQVLAQVSPQVRGYYTGGQADTAIPIAGTVTTTSQKYGTQTIPVSVGFAGKLEAAKVEEQVAQVKSYTTLSGLTGRTAVPVTDTRGKADIAGAAWLERNAPRVVSYVRGGASDIDRLIGKAADLKRRTIGIRPLSSYFAFEERKALPFFQGVALGAVERPVSFGASAGVLAGIGIFSGVALPVAGVTISGSSAAALKVVGGSALGTYLIGTSQRVKQSKTPYREAGLIVGSEGFGMVAGYGIGKGVSSMIPVKQVSTTASQYDPLTGKTTTVTATGIQDKSFGVSKSGGGLKFTTKTIINPKSLTVEGVTTRVKGAAPIVVDTKTWSLMPTTTPSAYTTPGLTFTSPYQGTAVTRVGTGYGLSKGLTFAPSVSAPKPNLVGAGLTIVTPIGRSSFIESAFVQKTAIKVETTGLERISPSGIKNLAVGRGAAEVKVYGIDAEPRIGTATVTRSLVTKPSYIQKIGGIQLKLQKPYVQSTAEIAVSFPATATSPALNVALRERANIFRLKPVDVYLKQTEVVKVSEQPLELKDWLSKPKVGDVSVGVAQPIFKIDKELVSVREGILEKKLAPNIRLYQDTVFVEGYPTQQRGYWLKEKGYSGDSALRELGIQLGSYRGTTLKYGGSRRKYTKGQTLIPGLSTRQAAAGTTAETISDTLTKIFLKTGFSKPAQGIKVRTLTQGVTGELGGVTTKQIGATTRGTVSGTVKPLPLVFPQETRGGTTMRQPRTTPSYIAGYQPGQATDYIYSSKLKASTGLDFKQSPTSALDFKLKQITQQQPDFKLKQVPITDTRTDLVTEQIITPVPFVGVPVVPTFVPPEQPTPRVPPIGGISLPFFEFGGGLSRAKKAKFKPKYFASVEASVFRVVGKPSKFAVVSGLGIRPIQRR